LSVPRMDLMENSATHGPNKENPMQNLFVYLAILCIMFQAGF